MEAITKQEKIQEIGLRFLLENYESDYDHLLSLANKTTLDVRKLKFLAIEIFKTINSLNPSFMKEIFILNTRRDDQTKKLLVQNQTQKGMEQTP